LLQQFWRQSVAKRLCDIGQSALTPAIPIGQEVVIDMLLSVQAAAASASPAVSKPISNVAKIWNGRFIRRLEPKYGSLSSRSVCWTTTDSGTTLPPR
jgi:hypothetical protein